MSNVLDQLMDFLSANQTDPLTFLVVFFLFSLAAAVVLPIPIEIGLIWNPGMFFPLKALDMGLGKAVGSLIVFLIPILVLKTVRRIERLGPDKRLMKVIRKAAKKSGIERSRVYHFVGDLKDALKVALRKSGMSRSEVYGKIAANHSKSQAAKPLPKWGWLRWLAKKSEALVRKHGVIAVYVLLSIPGMIDTVILYIFAIINANRKVMTLRDFVLANFLAGINRAFIIYAVLEIAGIRLF